MRILLVTPARPGSRLGNRVTALRWQTALRALGHRVRIAMGFVPGFDLVVALHAKKSAHAILAAAAAAVPTVLAMTGTDLYRDIRVSRLAVRALEAADRIVVLHELGAQDLPRGLRRKVRVVEQSAVMPPSGEVRRVPHRVSVIGHLRAEKDPFRTAMAVRGISVGSRPPPLEIVHVGRALSEGMERRAEREMGKNPRYEWLGERSPAATRRILAQSWLLVLSSRIEGGANVLSEALIARTPILASRIPSSVGILGSDFPGFFPVGDTGALRRLLERTLSDKPFYRSLLRAGAARRPRFHPARERDAWRALLAEFSP